ncbi:hypothetical protein [Limnohabitans sp. T6-20]|uniref:hypothetical protein n=1 Tax=Limnohabitans sp. T6-20 TaxID=1100725 RepID=UPI000D359AFE|nr:hypothetical protein [Limnohabitans sp. T6-20]PUE12561.1 hypothetical protein B9Z33_03315 [Limnohabitans sp. T6-20]
MNHVSHRHKAFFLLMGLLCFFNAEAGRPLTVDDANVNEVGEGHVEGWWARAPNGSRSWTLAPAYAPVQGVELGAGIAREQKTGLETLNVQAKFRITESQENGCNGGAVLGAVRTTGETSKGYVNALFTCNHARLGSLHTNLGALDFSSRQRVSTWGVAWERAYGEITAHVEVYGQQHDKPTWATGLRTNILPKLQLDASVGRQAGQNLVTIGSKWMF